MNDWRRLLLLTAASVVATPNPAAAVPPPRLEVVGVEDSAGSVALKPGDATPATLAAPLKDARAILRGRVVLGDATARTDGTANRVQVWVNGFPQVGVACGPPARHGREMICEFRAPIQLSRPRNEVVVKLGDEPLGVRGEPRFFVDCRNPDATARLHLWVVGVGAGAADGPGLLARAVAALNGEMTAADRLRTPAFRDGVVYGPDCGVLRRFGVLGRLDEVRAGVALGPDPSKDVVVIFYQGDRPIDPDHPALRLRPGGGRDADGLFPFAEVRRLWDDARRPRVFVVDAAGAPADAPLYLSESAHWVDPAAAVGLLRLSRPVRAGAGAAPLKPVNGLRDAVQQADPPGGEGAVP